MTHTVADIHAYVMCAAPVDGEYQLITGFPPKPLENPNLTVQQAGLKNAAITQKIIWVWENTLNCNIYMSVNLIKKLLNGKKIVYEL